MIEFGSKQDEQVNANEIPRLLLKEKISYTAINNLDQIFQIKSIILSIDKILILF